MSRLSALACVSIILLAISCSAAVNAPANGPNQPVMTPHEMKFVELANQERASRGLPKLEIDPLLVTAARDHSREMCDKGYFSHNAPTPGRKTPMDRYLAVAMQRPRWALVGENLFYCSKVVDAQEGHSALMNSEGHKANILEKRFERIGVGEGVDAKGQFYVTEMFLARTD